MTDSRATVVWKGIRDGVLFAGGLAILFHETIMVTNPNVAIIGAAITMLGLPSSLLGDRLFRSRRDDSDD